MDTSSDVKVKKEPGEDVEEVTRNHRFSIQFEARDNRPYEIDGEDFQTVLEAIRSVKKHPAQGWSDEKLLIQRKIGGSDFTIATHFPCCLIKEDETLSISKRKDKVQEARENRNVLPEESYSVFYIDSEGANNTKIERLFISSQRQGLKPLCVYGEKGITAKEALEQDGRFRTLGSFNLIDCNKEKVLQSSAVVNKLHERKFKIELLEENVPEKSKSTASVKKEKMGDTASNGCTNRTPAASNMAKQTSNVAAASALTQQSGIGVMKAAKESGASLEEIKKILRDQFPDLKELMESRFPADSFEKELIMREENFGKMRQSFREVHRLEKLIKLGKSVCRVVIKGICKGTGFVLIDNFILTNAHLFKTCTDGDKLKEGTEVYVQFNYEDPQTGEPPLFKVEDTLICFLKKQLDFAVLQVNPQALTQSGVVQFPSGLLERVGQMPENGEACIIGHPGGEVKQIDPTFIIEMENRGQAVLENLPQYKGKPYGLFVDQVKKNGIERIMMGGDRAEKVITYHTFMYHGASGSPVFDADGFLCGLHTAGFSFGYPKAADHVMEYAYSMKTIITHLVNKLGEPNQENLPGLLERMKNVAGENNVLKRFLDQ